MLFLKKPADLTKVEGHTRSGLKHIKQKSNGFKQFSQERFSKDAGHLFKVAVGVSHSLKTKMISDLSKTSIKLPGKNFVNYSVGGPDVVSLRENFFHQTVNLVKVNR